MAMTQTKTVERVQVHKINDEWFLRVMDRITIDDPDDDQLPIYKDSERNISRYVATTDENGVETVNPRDLSGEDQVVQDIAAAVWK